MGNNAQNNIQSINLNEVLSANNGVFITEDRLDPMTLNLVLPVAEFINLGNKACVLLFGGQKYINNEWIDIQIPTNQLQIICDQKNFFQSQRRVSHQFTAFDAANLQ